MDAMLIPLSALRKMKEQAPDLPFCCIAHGIPDIPFIGEDNFFVHRLRKAGIKLLVDTNVQCLHIDLVSGKYTAHPSVNLKHYFTNMQITEPLTLDDKAHIDHRWTSKIPIGSSQYNVPGHAIPELIKHMQGPLRGVEIGTAQGKTTEYLLEKIPNLHLIGIDPYTVYKDWDGRILSYREQIATYNEHIDNMKKYKDRYTHMQMVSDTAYKLISDESLDFVFIDGAHTYDQVLNDCRNYYVKLKKGGLFCGHDYKKIDAVKRAVDAFCTDSGLQLYFANEDLWYLYKE